jgi:hypothetical protein
LQGDNLNQSGAYSCLYASSIGSIGVSARHGSQTVATDPANAITDPEQLSW